MLLVQESLECDFVLIPVGFDGGGKLGIATGLESAGRPRLKKSEAFLSLSDFIFHRNPIISTYWFIWIQDDKVDPRS